MANDLSKYYEFRHLMDTADLLTYDTEGAVPWMIQKWSPGANHAGMVLHLPEYAGEENRRWTLEASAHGPRMAYLSELLERLHGECYWHRLIPDIPDLLKKRNAAGCWALEQQGIIKYDFKGLLLFPIRRMSADMDKLLCSEYVQFSWAKGKLITMKMKERMAKPSDLPNAKITLPPIRIVVHRPFVQVPQEFTHAHLNPLVVNP